MKEFASAGDLESFNAKIDRWVAAGKPSIHPDIIDRYDKILCEYSSDIREESDPGTSYSHLRWMLNELRTPEKPYGKANRWLGFIQGMMISHGMVKVLDERNFTREYFQGEFTPR